MVYYGNCCRDAFNDINYRFCNGDNVIQMEKPIIDFQKRMIVGSCKAGEFKEQMIKLKEALNEQTTN